MTWIGVSKRRRVGAGEQEEYAETGGEDFEGGGAEGQSARIE
jgi:hypothetical protein